MERRSKRCSIDATAWPSIPPSSSQTCLCLFKFLCCNRAKEIGSADNADNAPVAQHRYTLNPMGDQQAADFGKLCIFDNANNRSRHNIVRALFQSAETTKKIGVKRFPFREQSQPPVTARLAIRLVAGQ